ncbi:hypothetical protein B0T24DRAFT_716545 [Lasiosphaeria ovina]|uniref:Uncharacterized protein n=1 Tax=Lasiosphaeria ovina TaxID=92902 RepID=A0AAE0KLG7_9PEZI|nr:hypothetical protein B0T24DRAFT_716545 [Lasiosphaeria ovina]
MPRSGLKLRPIADPDLKTPGVVAYSSINEATGTSFSAATDPNSPHAARLARLAVQVQTNEHDSRRRRLDSGSRPSAWLPWLTRGSSHQQQPNTRQLAYPGEATRQQTWTTGDAAARALPSTASFDAASNYTASSSAYVSYATTQDQATYSPHGWASSPTRSSASSAGPLTAAYVPEANVVTVSPPGTQEPLPLEVVRYRTDTKTAYRVKGVGQEHASGKRKLKRELYVSAPVGSNEAALFDAIADANSR